MSFPDGGNGGPPVIFLATFARTNPHIVGLENTAINNIINTLKKQFSYQIVRCLNSAVCLFDSEVMKETFLWGSLGGISGRKTLPQGMQQ